MKERIKVLLDFDGTLTNEERQAKELKEVALGMLGEMVDKPVLTVETRYEEIRSEILSGPENYPWVVNGLIACYAYEGPYLLNTVVMQNIILGEKDFLEKINRAFPEGVLDSVTLCVNHLFHQGSFGVRPHFLTGAGELLVELIKHELVSPTIFTNSKGNKIVNNLRELEIGSLEDGEFENRIRVLGDTKQYVLDSKMEHGFSHHLIGQGNFSVDLRRPFYYQALRREGEGKEKIVVVADGFSLAGALPLAMGHHFILMRTAYTPDWVVDLVLEKEKGTVAEDLDEMRLKLLGLVE